MYQHWAGRSALKEPCGKGQVHLRQIQPTDSSQVVVSEFSFHCINTHAFSTVAAGDFFLFPGSSEKRNEFKDRRSASLTWEEWGSAGFRGVRPGLQFQLCHLEAK